MHGFVIKYKRTYYDSRILYICNVLLISFIVIPHSIGLVILAPKIFHFFLFKYLK